MTASSIETAGRLDASFHLGSRATGASWSPIAGLVGALQEGQRFDRVDKASAEAPHYRPGHLGQCVFWPEPEHLLRPPHASVHAASHAVGIGDLVIARFPPVQSAWVTPATPRHAPDANCLSVVGPAPGLGLWLGAVLEHPLMASTIAARTQGAVLPRITLRDLGEIQVPVPAAAEFMPLAADWSDAADLRLTALREQALLGVEVQALADDLGVDPPHDRMTRWVPRSSMPESWAPDQAALYDYRRELAARGWSRLGDLVPEGPARLRRELPASRILLLSDADPWFGFRVPELRPVHEATFRLYADPLRRGEVLLSTLGTSPKVVFVPPGDSPLPTLWLSDQWARLGRGPAHGAVALMLGTRQVRWQLARAATGAVRQFIARTELAEIRLPPLSGDLAESLDRRLLAAMVRRAQAEHRLDLLRGRLDALVTAALETPT